MDNKQDKGFTLVELLIVIVILGILATVTVFAVRGITDRGQTNACSRRQRTLDTAASRRTTPRPA
jgi:prepilin-type N-terminal cleavage/methylation domain-containing protein